MILSVILGTALSLLFAVVVWQLEQVEVRDRFERDAVHLATSAASALQSDLSTLYALGAFYTSSEVVTGSEFRSFTQTLLENHPSVQALGWVPRILGSERATFETTFNLPITELDPDGTLIPAQERAEYLPVAFTAPMSGNEALLGFDLTSIPSRLEALRRARDTGEAAVTRRLTLVQDLESGYGVRAHLPLYQAGIPLGTVEQRQEALKGFVTLDLHLGTVIESALAPHGFMGLQLLVCDDDASLDSRFLYGIGVAEPEGTLRCTDTPATGLQYQETFVLADRSWSLLVTPAPGRYALAASWRPWLLLLLGLTLTALLTSHLRLLHRRAQELSASQRSMRYEIQQRKAIEKWLHDANEELSRLATEDKLTGLANRRRFDAVLKREWHQAQRSHAPLSLILLDIDRFKVFNDHYGHEAGDRVLQQVATALRSIVQRPSDLVARYGGEEFAVILPDTPADGALALAENMRKAVEAVELALEDRAEPSPLTISLGVGTYLGEPALTVHTYVERVDKALYAAKQQGRNRIAAVNSSG
jgi:diguanylate cyclase (GGDEF)-like protein